MPRQRERTTETRSEREDEEGTDKKTEASRERERVRKREKRARYSICFFRPAARFAVTAMNIPCARAFSKNTCLSVQECQPGRWYPGRWFRVYNAIVY